MVEVLLKREEIAKKKYIYLIFRLQGDSISLYDF